MKYDFDEFVERRGTNCVKWDESPSDDVIPLWVADMDFRVAPAIQNALEQRVRWVLKTRPLKPAWAIR